MRNKNKYFFSDLAIELTSGESCDKEGLKRTQIIVDEKLGEKINRDKGCYVTLESDFVLKQKKSEYARLSRAIQEEIEKLSANASNILVACLGNPEMTADALGYEVFKRLKVTRHLKCNGIISLSSVCPNVMGATGIESYDIIKGVTENIQPDLVIVVDSLASANTARIASAFQISNGGIVPGSGVSNHRKRISSDTLGVRVLTLGVPLVVYASTIVGEVTKKEIKNPAISDMIVTPKDIDILVKDCGEVLSSAVNGAYVGDV